MKFYVCKKRYHGKILASIFVSFIMMSLGAFSIVVTLIYDFFISNLTIGIIFLIFPIVIYTLAYKSFRHEGSIISFNDSDIKCSFRGKTRMVLNYDDIHEYGIILAKTLLEKDMIMIYLSQHDLSGKRRSREVPLLYYKNKNVVMLEYNEDALKLIQNRCFHATPYLDWIGNI